MENVTDASEFYRGKKCIWMDANVVAYKLCDQNYDCERCSFDFVMRNTWKEKTDSEQVMSRFGNNNIFYKAIRNISNIRCDEELNYLKGQVVLKKMFGGIYTIGINQLLLTLLENISSVKILHGYGIIKKDEPLVELNGKWGRRVISAPMDITFLQKLKIDIDDLPGDSWFGVVSIAETGLASVKYPVEQSRTQNQCLISQLQNYLVSAPEAGATMMDGGKSCEYLYEVLGIEEFRRMISELY